MACVELTYDGIDYVLTFNRKTVQQLESIGFNIEDYDAKPATFITQLFRGSFLAKHSKVKEETVNKIWGLIGDKEGLIKALMELYLAPVESLLEEVEDEEKKVVWGKKE